MKYELLIKEEAQADITECFQQDQPKIGDDFPQTLDDAFEQILPGPEMFATVHNEIRQMKIRRFPYVTSYLSEVDRIVVLAVLHGHRNPEAWKQRS